MTVFEQKGYTKSGVDLIVIDENTFQKGNSNDPYNYLMRIDVLDPVGTNVDAKTNEPISIKVI